MKQDQYFDLDDSSERQILKAYIHDDSTRKTIDLLAAEFNIKNYEVKRGGIKQAINDLAVQRSPKFLIVDISNSELPMSLVNELAEVCEPSVSVIAIGERNDVGLFRDLVNNGIADYLVKPITSTLLTKSLAPLLGNTASTGHSSRLGRLIVVAGTRGGVGTTMTATGLAWSFAHRRRRRVALFDLDLHFGTSALAFDVEPNKGLREALEHPGRIDGLFIERTTIKHSDTLHILCAEEAMSDLCDINCSALESLISALRIRFHYIIVDLPRRMNLPNQQLLHNASTVVLVSDPSVAGIRDTVRYTNYLSNLRSPPEISICVNRFGENRSGEISRSDFERAISRPIDAAIPYDARNIYAAMNLGIPITSLSCKAATIINDFAHHLAGGTGASKITFRSLISSFRRS